jgi:hypothetical protein
LNWTSTSYVPKLERVHDYFIMEAILHSGKFKDKEIRWINYCRLYLQAVTISDLTLANGDYLDEALLAGNPTRWSSAIKWHHFTQAKPSQVQWKVWRIANRIWSDESGRLHQPLRRWQHPVGQQRRTWTAYGDLKGTIYLRTINLNNTTNPSSEPYSRYSLNITSNDSIYYEVPMTHLDPNTSKMVRLPSRVTPLDTRSNTADTGTGTSITIIYDVNTVRQRRPRLTPISRRGKNKGLGNRNIDFLQYIQQLPQWEAELLQYVKLTYDIYILRTIKCDGGSTQRGTAQ